ncbi:MAG: hypothetical protein KF752_19360 [Pirellulaceae bacterium]|nr:hypothetical protein [Pirellulaceae bacterium]
MQARKKLVWTGFLSLAALTIVVVPLVNIVFGQEPGSGDKQSFMRLKLEPTKKIIEGIALGDFPMIRSNTEQLRKLALDQGWLVLQTETYAKHSRDFQSSLNLMRLMCDQQDLDGVTLAYMQMTMRCVQCHKMLRDQVR